jgi:hypothetical protein
MHAEKKFIGHARKEILSPLFSPIQIEIDF